MDISDLVVVDINVSKETPVWEGKERMFCGEACAFQLLVGNQQNDLLNIPQNVLNDRDTKVFFGENAYAYLLGCATGLDDRNPGETRIIGDMKRAWERLELSQATTAAAMRNIIETLFRDSKTIRNQILSKMRAYSSEVGVTARAMAGLAAGQGTVLLVAEKEGLTDTMLAILGNHAKHIILTHPDAAQLDLRFRDAQLMIKNKKINATISTVASDNIQALQDTFEMADHVMVLQPMDANPAYDALLMSAWRERVRADGKFFHLKGDPQNRGKTSEAWSVMPPRNFVSLDELKAQREADGSFNANVIALARNACHNCANALDAGKDPVTQFLHLAPNDYKSRFGKKKAVDVQPIHLNVEHLAAPIKHNLLPLLPESTAEDQKFNWALFPLDYNLGRHYVQIQIPPNQIIQTPERDGVKAFTYIGTDLPPQSQLRNAKGMFLEGNLTKASRVQMENSTIFSAYALEPGSMINGGDAIIISNKELSHRARNFTKPLSNDATLIVVPETQREGIFLLMTGMVASNEVSPETPDLKLSPNASNLREILHWLKDNNLLVFVQAAERHQNLCAGIKGIAQEGVSY